MAYSAESFVSVRIYFVASQASVKRSCIFDFILNVLYMHIFTSC